MALEKEAGAHPAQRAELTLTPELNERLKVLGYVQ